MVTLKNLYTVFGHDPKWSALATKSLQPMVSVYLRKFGNTDITMITDFDLQMQVEMSEQSAEVKAKAKSCMDHLRSFAIEKGHPFAIPDLMIEHECKKERVQEMVILDEKVKSKHPKRGEIQQERRKEDIQMSLEEWQADTIQRRGTIEKDTASNGWKNGKRIYKDCWRAVIQVNGQRYRYRANTREGCREWLKAVCSKKILPTDNKADWWRMEQRKDEVARIDQQVMTAAEEANIVLEYRRSGDTTALYDYCVNVLLPHMVYYCARSLNMGKERTLTASRQAVGLILTRIVGGRPITNITFTCKHMLRIHRNRGDFWYYEKAPRDVQMMVDGIDFSDLAEVWKVTKDRRI